MKDQTLEKQMFCTEKAEEIKTLSSAIKAAANRLFESGYFDVLPIHQALELKEHLEKNELEQFSCTLRQYAVCFNQKSTNYWCIIDATNSLLDAIGERWPYMTFFTREYRLKHAQEHLSEML